MLLDKPDLRVQPAAARQNCFVFFQLLFMFQRFGSVNQISSAPPFRIGVIRSIFLTLHSSFLKVRAKQPGFSSPGDFYGALIIDSAPAWKEFLRIERKYGLTRSVEVQSLFLSLNVSPVDNFTWRIFSFMWGTLWCIDNEPADHRQIQKNQHQKKQNQERSKGSNPIKESDSCSPGYFFSILFMQICIYESKGAEQV